MVDLGRRLVAECLGTGILVTTVVGSGIMAERLTQDGALALLGNAPAFMAAQTIGALIGWALTLWLLTSSRESQKSGVSNGDCFATQVEAILSTRKLTGLDVVAVKVEYGSTQNTILDTGSDAQVLMDRAVNAFHGTPAPGPEPAERP